jgi:hypothetical protein
MSLIESDEISNRLKTILNQFISQGSNKKNSLNSPHKQDPYDTNIMALETPLAQPVPYNINSASSQTAIYFFKQEKVYRIQSRTLHIEKINDKIPSFIKECSTYGKFFKEASFENLSYLIDEILQKGASLASQSYSPSIVDSLSQDSIFEKTSKFITEVFKDQFLNY